MDAALSALPDPEPAPAAPGLLSLSVDLVLHVLTTGDGTNSVLATNDLGRLAQVATHFSRPLQERATETATTTSTAQTEAWGVGERATSTVTTTTTIVERSVPTLIAEAARLLVMKRQDRDKCPRQRLSGFLPWLRVLAELEELAAPLRWDLCTENAAAVRATRLACLALSLG